MTRRCRRRHGNARAYVRDRDRGRGRGRGQRLWPLSCRLPYLYLNGYPYYEYGRVSLVLGYLQLPQHCVGPAVDQRILQ